MQKQFFTAEDVARILNKSTSYSYKLIKNLNTELAEKGFYTVRGRIPASYFYDRLCGRD